MDQDDNGSEYGTSGYPEEHVRPSMSAPRGPPGPYRAIYSDLQDMQETKRRRIDDRMDVAYEEGRVSGAPADPADQRVYIKDLFDAFNSVEIEGDDAIIDKPTKHGRLSQAATKFKENHYPAYAIEEVCWEIFDKARIVQMDVKLLEAFHESKFEGPMIHTSFGQRWTAICGACTRSKALCKMLLDAPYLDRFVSHPQGELKMKLNNKKINAQRDAQNEIGRQFLSKGVGPEAAATALAKLLPEEAQPYDKYARFSPHQTSRGNAAGPKTPIAPARIQPTRSAVTNSTKRKNMSESEDEDESEEEDYIDSAVRSNAKPTLRGRRATLKTPTRSNTTNSVMSKTPQTKKTKGQPTNTRSRLVNTKTPVKSQEVVEAEAEDDYKKTICRLLGLDPKNAKVMAYSLEDLRWYARAYNVEYMETAWSHPQWPDYKGLGHLLKDKNDNRVDHFSIIIKSLMPLAKLRGDYVDGKLMPHRNRTFKPKSQEDRMALGSAMNAVRFHAGYPAPVSIESHGTPQMIAENTNFKPQLRQHVEYQHVDHGHYQRSSTYDQSTPKYHSYSHNRSQHASHSPYLAASTSRGYNDGSFQQRHLGNQQSYTPNPGYNFNTFGSNPQASTMFNDGLGFSGPPHTGYSTSFRGQPPSYNHNHTVPTSPYTTPQLGHNVGLVSQSPHLPSLTTQHSDGTYPDPEDCSSQQNSQ
ncbi:uncharacterized protein EAE98_006924 [Botrytis deweyae]|uniref:Uncharacterized protein n=1 Tax=Botrytis deweyae TaxID=2478750 RepID=A0ABQ7IJ47_9HELO|nr:uncharacterized protein EAE98_006924 [Botrytis deweyae]KAF7925699.1 hypothetical protein EAE98_006924 [Botrytis deweyae]